MIDVTVITPSIPRRSWVLNRCIDSVRSQGPVWRVRYHAIMIDNGHPEEPAGPAVLRNRMLDGVDTEWIVFLDDDDVINHNFFERLWPYTEDADVIIPHCDFDGPAINSIFVNQPEFSRAKLREHGQFPITVLARTHAVLHPTVDGFDIGEMYEDWGMWNRSADAGFVFKVVPEKLWTYRTRIDPNDDRRTAQAMEGRR
jgi:glycosyltransferase involved in cell wall biosynthesis